jgi:coenzyme F420-reducing hydrogenase alpha subunit
MTEVIKVDPVTRVEGHSEIDIVLDDDKTVEEVRFSVKIFRGFEKFLVGQPVERLPELTARICGICYTVHSLSSCKAIEDAMNIKISPEAHKLRQLLSIGNFIESHLLSIAILSMPDILFFDKLPEERNIANLLKKDEALVEGAMKLRQAGSLITKIAGRRQVHPISPVIGGVIKPISKDEADEIRELLDGGLDTLKKIWSIFISKFTENMDIWKLGDIKSKYLSIIDKEGVEFYDGDIAVLDENGELINKFKPQQYLDFVEEEIKDYSYMKFPRLKKEGIFRVGPLARFNINRKFKTPVAAEMFEELSSTFEPPLHNTMSYHLARIIEAVYSVEMADNLLNDEAIYTDKVKPKTYKSTSGRGFGVVEAPRGTLVHIYDIDKDGFLEDAKFYVATQHNNFSINEALTHTAKNLINTDKPDEKDLNKLEMIVRAYDPCLACATHAMLESFGNINLYKTNGELIRRL